METLLALKPTLAPLEAVVYHLLTNKQRQTFALRVANIILTGAKL